MERILKNSIADARDTQKETRDGPVRKRRHRVWRKEKETSSLGKKKPEGERKLRWNRIQMLIESINFFQQSPSVIYSNSHADTAPSAAYRPGNFPELRQNLPPATPRSPVWLIAAAPETCH